MPIWMQDFLRPLLGPDDAVPEVAPEQRRDVISATPGLAERPRE